MDKETMRNNTNSSLGRKMNCTARQISKSRKRGYIINNDGNKVKYKAPTPVFIITTGTGKAKKYDKQRTT